MSYWVNLKDREGRTVSVDRHEEGGTYAVGGANEAELNVTYNYSSKFNFRALDRRIARDTVEELEEAVRRLEVGPDGSSDYWEPTDGNVCRAVRVLLSWAKQNPEAVWEVH